MSKASEHIHGNVNYDDFLFPERERVLFSELLHYITENVQFLTTKKMTYGSYTGKKKQLLGFTLDLLGKDFKLVSLNMFKVLKETMSE